MYHPVLRNNLCTVYWFCYFYELRMFPNFCYYIKCLRPICKISLWYIISLKICEHSSLCHLFKIMKTVLQSSCAKSYFFQQWFVRVSFTSSLWTLVLYKIFNFKNVTDVKWYLTDFIYNILIIESENLFMCLLAIGFPLLRTTCFSIHLSFNFVKPSGIWAENILPVF